jgi:hypothetical protein
MVWWFIVPRLSSSSSGTLGIFRWRKPFDQHVVGSMIKRRDEQSIYSESSLVRGKKSDESSSLERG